MRHLAAAADVDVVSSLRVELSQRGYERAVETSPAAHAQHVEIWRHAHDDLAARIWIVSGSDDLRGALTAGDISMYPDTREIEVAGAEVHLTPTEFEFLRLLIEAGGKIVPVFRFFSVTRRLHMGAHSNGISVHMCFLRKKLTAAGATTRVKTVRAVGFRLVH